MWISEIRITNIKSFEGSTKIILDRKINIILGENNAGKSVIIKSLNLLQNRSSLSSQDLRYGSNNSNVVIKLEGPIEGIYRTIFRLDQEFEPEMHYTLNANGSIEQQVVNKSGLRATPDSNIPNYEPNNFIYPFFSKRKVGGFEETINRDFSNQVNENLSNLYAKVDRLSDRNHPAHEEYRTACQEIIGFPISAQLSQRGKQAGIWLDETNTISLEAMGDGVPHLLGLIVNLCIAKNKLFLIEEIENDIHPKALKNLLKLIIAKADVNQFVVSTHSNIVAKYLGSVSGSKLHYITRNINATIPTAIYRKIPDTIEERRAVLEELGYEMTDYNLWQGWLILEESSAEKIINNFLIPKFASGLIGKLRSIAAGGISQVEPKFEDFNRLFLFTHLEQSYKNRAWVIVDNGEVEKNIINSLIDRYTPSGWNADQFMMLTKHEFEEYYPDEFQNQVHEVLSVNDKQTKRLAKKGLLDKVVSWIEEDEDIAMVEFSESAKEIIGILQNIERELCQ